MAGQGPEPSFLLRPPPPSGRSAFEGGLFVRLSTFGRLSLGALERPPGLRQEDIVQAGLVELECRDLHAGLVEGANDVRQLLTALLDANRSALWRTRHKLAEG